MKYIRRHGPYRIMRKCEDSDQHAHMCRLMEVFTFATVYDVAAKLEVLIKVRVVQAALSFHFFRLCDKVYFLIVIYD